MGAMDLLADEAAKKKQQELIDAVKTAVPVTAEDAAKAVAAPKTTATQQAAAKTAADTASKVSAANDAYDPLMANTQSGLDTRGPVVDEFWKNVNKDIAKDIESSAVTVPSNNIAFKYDANTDTDTIIRDPFGKDAPLLQFKNGQTPVEERATPAAPVTAVAKDGPKTEIVTPNDAGAGERYVQQPDLKAMLSKLSNKAEDGAKEEPDVNKYLRRFASIVQALGYGLSGHPELKTIDEVANERQAEADKEQRESVIRQKEAALAQDFELKKAEIMQKYDLATLNEQQKLQLQNELASLKAQHDYRMLQIPAEARAALLQAQAMRAATKPSFVESALGG